MIPSRILLLFLSFRARTTQSFTPCSISTHILNSGTVSNPFPTRLASLKPPDIEEGDISSKTNTNIFYSFKARDEIIIDVDPNAANDSEPGSVRTLGLQETLKEKIFLGIEPTPEVLSIMAIYFVEGALGLARLAQTFFLKDELHLGPAELSALTGLFTLPWTIKVSLSAGFAWVQIFFCFIILPPRLMKSFLADSHYTDF